MDRILPLKQTADGWHVLTVHWSKVPNYNYASACKGMAESDIQRELEISWTTTSGLRVYPQFRREIHVASAPLPYDPAKPLYASWDWGLSPACCLAQINCFGQLQIFPSFHPDEGEFEGIYPFAERVATHLQQHYATPYGISLKDLPMVHIGDPAGNQRIPGSGKNKEAQSCFEILNRGLKLYIGEDDRGEPVYQEKPGWGWVVIPGEVRLTKRLEAVRGRLTTLLRDGFPALIVDPRADFIIQAMLGGYAYKQYSDGTYSHDPDKNQFSHIADAIGYLCTRLFVTPDREDGEEGYRPRRSEPFRSQAANRWSY